MLERLASWIRSEPTPVALDESAAPALNERLAALPAEERLRWAWETFGRRASIGTSFQPAGVVILHLAKRHQLPIPAFSLDTGLLFRETIELKSALQDHLDIRIESILPDLTLTEQARLHGERLWERNADACCDLRKVKPLDRHLRSVDLWITGVRRDQSAQRATTQLLEVAQREDGSRFWKLNPLADWGRDRVWRHIREHHLPYNALHDRGYRSIGCSVCTHATSAGEDDRAGRWVGLAKTECGLHTRFKKSA